jgi:transposase
MLKARNGHKKAVVAVARKLAVILHAMWKTGAAFCAEPIPVKTECVST